MARTKKNRAVKPLVSTGEHGETVVRTGVYRTTLEPDAPPQEITPDECAKLLEDDLASVAEARQTLLRDVRRAAWRSLEPYATKAPSPLPAKLSDWPKGCTARRLDNGTGPAVYYVRELDHTTAEGIIFGEALNLFERLDTIEHAQETSAKVYAAFAAGRLLERLFVRTLEHLALSPMVGRKRGGEATRKLEAKEKKWCKTEGAELRRKGMSKNSAAASMKRDLAARGVTASLDTIKRAAGWKK